MAYVSGIVFMLNFVLSQALPDQYSLKEVSYRRGWYVKQSGFNGDCVF